MSYKGLFKRFLTADPERLHFAAHSHHPWPDVSYVAHLQYWEDSARLMDDKWNHVFGRVVPELRIRIAGVLGLPDPGTLVFAPNTHELLVRLFSCLRPPVRVVTSDAEFHSFARQSRRWEEAGLASVTRVAAEPFATFPDRISEAMGAADLVYLSQVFFDSGYIVQRLESIVAAAPADAWVVIDGYHAYMAFPLDLAPIATRAFFLAGGYKYAMAGEGACFMHCPPGYGDRPPDTGWFASFGDLVRGSKGVPYADGGDRFWGATFDPSGLYRMLAVLKELEAAGIGPAVIADHVQGLQRSLLERGPLPGALLPPLELPRGNFLTFRTPHADRMFGELHHRKVITDYRGDRLRIGFGIYQDPADVQRLSDTIAAIG
ncbi:MAG TPA: class V aminotransferase [Acidimicrobiia bacterium]